jgi:hypothetical protein
VADSGRSGWLTFAGVLLLLAGALNVIAGFEALHHGNEHLHKSQIVYSNLTVWGLIFLVWGAAQMIAGGAALAEQPFGFTLGIGLATVGALIWFFLMFAAPGQAAIGVALNVLVAWALTEEGRQGGMIDD